MMPRPIEDFSNIEVTSRCNLTCGYCIHPGMPRPKMDMTEDTWEAAKSWLRFFCQHGTQGELNLSGTGEPTLHPELPRLCLESRAILGPSRALQFTTNGRGLTEALVKALVPSKPQVCVTAHHASIAGPAVALLMQYGLLRSVSCDPVQSPQNWAGQVNWPSPKKPVQTCGSLRDGRGFVSADGQIFPCCMDATGESAIGSVTAPPSFDVLTRDWRVCPSCWQAPPVH